MDYLFYTQHNFHIFFLQQPNKYPGTALFDLKYPEHEFLLTDVRHFLVISKWNLCNLRDNPKREFF